MKLPPGDWMPRDLTADKSILIQIMAWCRYEPLPEPITWTDTDHDLCRHVASHKELMSYEILSRNYELLTDYEFHIS